MAVVDELAEGSGLEVHKAVLHKFPDEQEQHSVVSGDVDLVARGMRAGLLGGVVVQACYKYSSSLKTTTTCRLTLLALGARMAREVKVAGSAPDGLSAVA